MDPQDMQQNQSAGGTTNGQGTDNTVQKQQTPGMAPPWLNFHPDAPAAPEEGSTDTTSHALEAASPSVPEGTKDTDLDSFTDDLDPFAPLDNSTPSSEEEETPSFMPTPQMATTETPAFDNQLPSAQETIAEDLKQGGSSTDILEQLVQTMESEEADYKEDMDNIYTDIKEAKERHRAELNDLEDRKHKRRAAYDATKKKRAELFAKLADFIGKAPQEHKGQKQAPKRAKQVSNDAPDSFLAA